MSVNDYKGHAVNLTLYDMSGAPLPPRAVDDLVLHAQGIATNYSLTLSVADTNDLFGGE